VAPGLRIATGVAISAILARYLGVRGYGEYSVVFAYAALFGGIFNDWGLGTIALREMSADRPAVGQIVGSAASVQAVLACGSYIVLVGGLLLTPYPDAVKLACAVYGLTLLLSPLDIMALPLASRLRVARGIPATVLANGVTVVGVAAVAVGHGSLLSLIAVMCVGVVVQSVALTFIATKTYRVARPDLARARSLMGESWPLGVGTICSSITQQAPVLLLSTLAIGQAGLFNAASRFPLQAVLVPLMMRNSTFPLLSVSWRRDRQQFRVQMQRLLCVASVGGAMLATIGLGLGRPTLFIIFGPSFEPAAAAFAWMCVTAGLLYPGILLGEALIVAGLQRYNMAAQLLSLPVLLLLLALLIPLWGAAGAAAAVAAANLFLVLFGLLVARSRLASTFPLGWAARAAAVWVVGLGSAYLLRGLGLLAPAIGAVMCVAAGMLLMPTSMRWVLAALRASVSPAPQAT
jgi:O-antigen/teichoic acid export membrane protein